MDEDSIVWVGLVIIGLIVWGGYNLFFDDDESEEYTPSSYSSSNYGYEDSEECIEPENPFDDGTGHYAGFEWAETKGVSSCGGNSNSFIEGCEEYLSQEELFYECED